MGDHVDIEAVPERWERVEPFSIANFTWTAIEPLVVTARRDGAFGRGEGMPIFYRPGESAKKLADQVRAAASRAQLSRAALGDLLPANGARNALDCALWDLESKLAGQPVWRLASLPEPRPVLTVQTIGLAAPGVMAEKAADLSADFPLLKLKLGAAGDLERVEAVRRACPKARLVVDANTGWTLDTLNALASPLRDLGVEFIEQPLPPERNADLDLYEGPLPLCADESCQDLASLDELEGRFAYVNIKLDKTGGLTDALHLARAAQGRGFRLMVGNMIGTSLAMAPAYFLALLCDYADLDGAFGLARDREPPLTCLGGYVHPPSRDLWG